MILIISALVSPGPGASNGGSNFIFRHFEADMTGHEVAGVPQNLGSTQIDSGTSACFMSRLKCRRKMLDPQFDAPGSELPSAL